MWMVWLEKVLHTAVRWPIKREWTHQRQARLNREWNTSSEASRASHNNPRRLMRESKNSVKDPTNTSAKHSSSFGGCYDVDLIYMGWDRVNLPPRILKRTIKPGGRLWSIGLLTVIDIQDIILLYEVLKVWGNQLEIWHVSKSCWRLLCIHSG